MATEPFDFTHLFLSFFVFDSFYISKRKFYEEGKLLMIFFGKKIGIWLGEEAGNRLLLPATAKKGKKALQISFTYLDRQKKLWPRQSLPII